MIKQNRCHPLKPILLALLVGASVSGTQASVESEASEFISEVIPVKYSRASEIAAALLRMATNNVPASTAANSPGAVLSTGATANPPHNVQSNAWSHSSQRLKNLLHKNATIVESQELGQPPIIADERTNSLLIYAKREEMQRIKECISRLDVAGAQVLIDALVIQVPARGSNTLGMSCLRVEEQRPDHHSFGAGALIATNLHSVTRLLPLAQTNATASQPGGFDYLGRLTNDLDAVVLALSNDSQIKILERPRIQTSQGRPASCLVCESQPYSTSSYHSGSGYSGYSSIPKLEVGVTLDLRPFVMPDGSVAIDIIQRIDEVLGSVTTGKVGSVPNTKSSVVQASVVLRNRETFLLGGLMETDKDTIRSGVPILKDIPLLGALFRGSTARPARNELIILIRPTVLPYTGQNGALSQK